MTYPAGRATLIGADENQLSREQGITVKALLISIFPNVILPSHLASSLIQCVELAGARPNVNQVTRDRGYGKDSTTSVELPKLPRWVT
jgi:hypothetical protein